MTWTCGADLAVGAPYEGSGVVYIFRGSSSGLIPEYSQRIAASDLFASPPSSFGASLAAGVDLDLNGYPDLVVGAFASNTMVVLRTRPVINIMHTVTTTPQRIDRKQTHCDADDSSNVCIEIEVCFRFSAEPREW